MRFTARVVRALCVSDGLWVKGIDRQSFKQKLLSHPRLSHNLEMNNRFIGCRVSKMAMPDSGHRRDASGLSTNGLVAALLLVAALQGCGKGAPDVPSATVSSELPKTAEACTARLKELEQVPNDNFDKRAIAKHCLYLPRPFVPSPHQEWTVK
jgi:entry exclusion lipoprotein TrbK